MDEERSSMVKGLLVVVAGLAVLVGVPVLVLLRAKPQMVPAPTSYGRYTAADKSFVCASPGGWESTGGSSHGVIGGVLFKKGAARISITSDVVGAIMGDMAAATSRMESGLPGMPGAPAPRQVPPVEKLHAADREAYAARLKSYEEGSMKPFRSQVGEARYTEYTADGGFKVGKVHGYRASILGSERRIVIVCQCPEGSWPALKPAFQRVMASVGPGPQ